MKNENPIPTLGYYSRPIHKGYRNTIELPDGNNVVPLRSNTIRLVKNKCSFHELRSEDPNQHLKNFLKLLYSLDLDVANRERTRLRLFKFSLRDQASDWLEHESQDIRRDDPDNRARGNTKGIDEVDKESEESKREVEEEIEEEEEDDPKYFDTFPTIKELEDTTSVIDHYLGGMVLGKPFVKEIRLVYDKDVGTITFKRDKENITFKMPHKMERFRHIDRDILKIDNIPPFIITDKDCDQEKTYHRIA
nr:zinc finger, CCHC-type [Tanacetum cinerariifolium]